MFNVLRNWVQRYFSDEEAVVLAVLLFLAFTLVLTLGGMLAPVLAGLVLAFLMHGLVSALERLHMPEMAPSVWSSPCSSAYCWCSCWCWCLCSGIS
ncbi:hypothetical protein IBA8402_13140 [Pseudomonas syringae]